MVAENKSNCLRFGVSSIKVSISSLNPAANIWSASSRITNFTCDKSKVRRRTWSSKRPGVPIITWGFLFNFCIWFSIVLPPITSAASIPCISAKGFNTSKTCFESSLVGVNINTSTFVFSIWILCRTGNKYANVFPVPVCDLPIISRPLKISGIACVWIGVGTITPCFFNISIKLSVIPNVANEPISKTSVSIISYYIRVQNK